MKNIQDIINQVHCADALEFLRELPDGCVDLCLVDPPYGIGESSKKNDSRGRPSAKWPNGKATDYGKYNWDQKRTSPEVIHAIRRVSRNQIIWGGNYYADLLPPSSCWIYWDKRTSGDFADGELAWTSFQSAVRSFTWMWNGLIQQDQRNKEQRVYPCQKPIKLGIWLLKNHAKPGQVVMDCYCGSGTFLVAAAQLGHPWIGVDNNPLAVKIARERIKIETAQLNIFHNAAASAKAKKS